MGLRSGATIAQLEELYRAEYDRFARVAGAIARDADAGHDSVQLAFANALRHRRSFRGDGPLAGWLWRIVVNEAKRHAAAGAATTSLDIAHDVATTDGEVDFGVREWIAALPERQRSVLFLRYFADLQYAQIAEVLEIDVGTVSATLSAAHRNLRKILMEVEQ